MHRVWKFNNITPSHPSHAVDIFCARPSMAIGWCLHRRLRRKRRKKNQRTFRRWPCAVLRSLARRREKVHGVWKFNNITPSHPSHPVDIGAEPSVIPTRYLLDSALPSMAVDGCLGRRLRRKTKKTNSSDSPSMAVRSFARRRQKCMGCGNLTI